MTSLLRHIAIAAFVTFGALTHATDLSEKLKGPVTIFIKSAEFRHSPFLADRTKNIGILKWKGVYSSTPIVIVPGRNEVGYQWAEIAFDLRKLGATGDIYVWDPPGQGLSDRLLPNDPDAGFIRQFDDYTKSLIDFLSQVGAESKQPATIIAHSMGGTIALNALAEDSALAAKLVLIAPMLDIRISSSRTIKIFFDAVVELLHRLNLFQKSVIGRAGAKNPHTSDMVRFNFRNELKNGFHGGVPGKTLSWIAAANRGISSALERAARIKIPILAFVAGNDKVIDPAGASQLAKNCQGNCQLVEIKESEHAMHEERDEMRTKLIAEIAKFLKLDCSGLLSK